MQIAAHDWLADRMHDISGVSEGYREAKGLSDLDCSLKCKEKDRMELLNGCNVNPLQIDPKMENEEVRSAQVRRAFL